MRVVVDTNVLVSAVLGGTLKVIVDAWKAHKFTLVVSEPIVREYLDVLNRPVNDNYIYPSTTIRNAYGAC